MVSTTQSSHKSNKFDSIDIMRGIAILMVILVHTSQKIEGDMFLRNFAEFGQMGVQMFFIASAFTLCFSLDIRRSKDPVYNFYLRRFFRIAPGYYVGILLYLIVKVLFGSWDSSGSWENGYHPLNIIFNVLFIRGLNPYATDLVPGGWSISTEMLFYLIFPLVFVIYKTLERWIRYSYLFVPVIMLTISLCMQYLLYAFTKNPTYFYNDGFIYFSILNQLPVFCVGITLYFAYKNGLLKRITNIYSMTFFLLLFFLSIFLFNFGTSKFIFTYSITPFISSLSFSFLFVMIQNNEFKNTLIARIGLLSYSCYLLHTIFAYYLTGYLSNKVSFLPTDLSLVIFYLLVTVITYFSASLIYKFVEVKGIALGKKVITLINQPSNTIIKVNRKEKSL